MVKIKQQIQFAFSPQIYRYLEDLIQVADSTSAGRYGEEVSIDTYQGGEPKSAENESNNGNFWAHLEDVGAIKINHEKGFDGLKVGATIEGEIVESGGVREFYFAKKHLRILDVQKIKAILQKRDEKPIIQMRVLELLAKSIAEKKSGTELIMLLKECDVPAMFIVYPETKWRMLFKVFRVLSTSQNVRAQRILYRIIETAVHPLFFDGDEEQSSAATKKYNGWLKYDHIIIDEGEVFIGPSAEEEDLGITDWVSSSGKVVDPKCYLIFPDQLAELWVLMAQVSFLVQAFQANPSLNRKIREGLYLEIIGGVEDLIAKGEVGEFSESYKRPFTSLITADIEARAKKTTPLELVSSLLSKIALMEPYPSFITKKMEEKSELIERVTTAIAGSVDENETMESWQRKSLHTKKMLDGAKAIAQRVVHEHTHRFENSIQEKSIDLNHKFPEQRPSDFYITKKGDDFLYNGRQLNLSRNTDYYKAFAALYAKLPEGGKVSYQDLGTEIESRLSKAKGKSTDEMRKFIQRNLTDKSNGFIRYARIPGTEDNGKPLVEVVRNFGVRFNNKVG